MEELQHLVEFAELVAAFGIFGGVALIVLKFGRFTGRMEQSVGHMSKSLDTQTSAICAMRKQNDTDHAKIHERIDKLCTGSGK